MHNEPQEETKPRRFPRWVAYVSIVAGIGALFLMANFGQVAPEADPVVKQDPVHTPEVIPNEEPQQPVEPDEPPKPKYPPLDEAAYDAKMLALANIKEEPPAPAPAPEPAPLAPAEGEGVTGEGGQPTPQPTTPPTPPKKQLWPVKAPYPKPGAILPFRRIIAYYGNFYAKGMGVLGEYPEEQMLNMLRAEAAKWEKADPSTPPIMAIDYIAITAQASPGKDGKYRARMPHDQIEKAIAIAEKVDGIVIVEVQPGFSPMLTEVKSLEPMLKHPKVHVALDPEFAMEHKTKRPGLVVGTLDASEVNEIADYLAKIVNDNDLPPKVLIIHRYTQAMLTNATKIKPLPEVQMLIDMDGWGPKAKKMSTYNSWIAPEPVQFTGFKLFYKNDVFQEGTVLMTPQDVLELTRPNPSFIQFQ